MHELILSQIQMDSLFQRTGFCTLFVGSGSSLHDDVVPTFHGAGDAEEFIPQMLRKTPGQLAQFYQQWLCQRGNSKSLYTLLSVLSDVHEDNHDLDTIRSLRTECKDRIAKSLRTYFD